MIAFIGEHKDSTAGGLRWGVEPMCAVLSEHGIDISPSTYYEWTAKAPTARSLRDEALVAVMVAERTAKPLVAALGSRKMWLYLRGKGHDVARCTIERLYREQGWEGARYGKKPRTTIPDPGHHRAPDLVRRRFFAPAPNRLWVADFTQVSTWTGKVYIAFVIDAYSRRIIGWRVASSMTTALVLDALEHALYTRAAAGVADVTGLISHSDAGSQGGFNRSSQHPRSWRCSWFVVSRQPIGRCVRSCDRPVIRSSSAMSRPPSGFISPKGCFRSRRSRRPGCRHRWVSAGSATLAGCHRST